MSNGKRDLTIGVDKNKERFLKQKEGDIFLTHDTDPKSTGVIIREEQIVAHTGEGKYGVVIKSDGEVALHGKLFTTAQPSDIVIGHPILGKCTFNYLSIMPSTIYTQVAGLLFRPPMMGMINNISKMFQEFAGLK